MKTMMTLRIFLMAVGSLIATLALSMCGSPNEDVARLNSGESLDPTQDYAPTSNQIEGCIESKLD